MMPRPAKIQYFEKDGALHYLCVERVRIPAGACAGARTECECSGVVPREIQERGIEAIKEYVEHQVKASVAEHQQRLEESDYIVRNLNIPIEIEYKGYQLKGKIVSAEDNTLLVRLEAPYQGESSVRYGFGAGKSGHHIFDKNGGLSESAIQSAIELLQSIFEREEHNQQHKEVIDLANQLNEGRPVLQQITKEYIQKRREEIRQQQKERRRANNE